MSTHAGNTVVIHRITHRLPNTHINTLIGIHNTSILI